MLMSIWAWRRGSTKPRLFFLDGRRLRDALVGPALEAAIESAVKGAPRPAPVGVDSEER